MLRPEYSYSDDRLQAHPPLHTTVELIVIKVPVNAGQMSHNI